MSPVTHGPNSRIALLKRNVFFQNLNDATLDAIAGKLVTREYKRHECIWFQGAPSNALMLIQDGYVKMIKHSEGGKDILIELLGPGDVIGAVALLEGRPYPAAACALDRTTLLLLSRNHFLDIVAHNPQVATQALVAIGARLRHAHEMMRQLAVKCVEARIANVLLLMASRVVDEEDERVVIPIRLARKDIAEMVGTALETTIRTFSKWKNAGIVVREQKYTVIADMAALKDIASGEHEATI
ncbi:MAG: Crp/Fnr family transcriptional regulator [Armatimonadetes bacterium]|nr:Crp/Fnr family transcriptional regulator [Armatimonadota bacterium]